MIKKLLLIAIAILSATILRQLVIIFLDTLPINEEEIKIFAKKIRGMSTEEIIHEAVRYLE